jgi:hypothetical protein
MYARRILYLGYYFKQLDWLRFRCFQTFVREQANQSRPVQWCHAIRSVFRYNISLEEYYNFHFYKIPEAERRSYAGTGYMYEYQRRMNPPKYRAVLSDKIRFLDVYQDFVRHDFLTLNELEKHPEKGHQLLQNPSGKIVLKSSDGQCGRGIEVRQTQDFTPASLILRLKVTGNDLVEAFVTQHHDLMRLSPSGLNTVRVITQLDRQNRVHFLGARLRITVNAPVDNLAAGNMAAPVDLETGRVCGPGVYSDITRPDEGVHPVTGTPIVGFQVPFWKETLAMCEAAALVDTRNRSVGWDVAVTDEGPELIEGNHDWCKLLWQLPVRQGLKPILEKFKNESRI